MFHLRPFRRTLLRHLPALSLLLALTGTLAAQDARSLFDEGMTAFRAGQYDQALSKFRAVIRMDPADAQTWRLLRESQDALVDLMVEGGEFATFAEEVLKRSREHRRSVMRDPEAAGALAHKAVTGSYPDRSRAIFELSTTFGPFGVPPLVQALSSGDENLHDAAIFALSRLGSTATIPLLAASRAGNAKVRMGVLVALAQLDDPRGRARILDLAANDEDDTIRSLAASFAQKFLVGTAGAAGESMRQGWAFYEFDPQRGLTDVENFGVVWKMEGSHLVPTDVPSPMVPYELARQSFERAMALGSAEARPALALVNGTEIAILDGQIAQGEDLGAQREQRVVAALSLPHADLDGGLSQAVQRHAIAAATSLAALLDGPGLVATSGLRRALTVDAPSLRVQAALTLAGAPDASSPVVGVLGEALAWKAIRVVQIVDSNDARRNDLDRWLTERGVTVIPARTGAEGLVNLFQARFVDAFVVADPLPDYYARRFVAEIRRHSGFAETPVLILGNKETGEIEGAEVLEKPDGEAVVASFGELGAARENLDATAAAAAERLASLAKFSPQTVSEVRDGLREALKRKDAVALPAMRALQRAGGETEVDALNAVLADEGRGTPARIAAADALAGIFSRMHGQPVDRTALEAGLKSEDAGLVEACARALGQAGPEQAEAEAPAAPAGNPGP